MKRLVLLVFLLSFMGLIFATEKKKALIFGISGQDGSYLTEFLLGKDYEVHGVKRYHSSGDLCFVEQLQKERCQQGHKDIVLHWGDLADYSSVLKVVQDVKPDEIYNLAAQSQVQVSFEVPEYTANCDGLGALRILEAIRQSGLAKTTRYYQASTSKFLQPSGDVGQKEPLFFSPNSPYATAKLYAFWMTKNYREAYGIFACNGVFFNHESERRSEEFLSRKITRSVARIANNLQNVLYLGNLNAKQDWGYASDYVEAMWLMLQQDRADDYIVATGEMHSVREFVELAFHEVGITIVWRGEGLDEKGCNATTGNVLVKVSHQFFRPLDTQILCGDASKAKDVLGWKPKTSFDAMVKLMVAYDLAHVK